MVKQGATVDMSYTSNHTTIDGICSDDISPKHAADMLDHARDVIGVDRISIATDDLFTTATVVAFAKTNSAAYSDGGYMMDAFNKGATELGKFIPALVDELWKRSWSNGENNMKKLIALFTPILFAASLFAAPASAIENSQLANAQVVSVSGGGQYHQCFLEGNPGCQ